MDTFQSEVKRGRVEIPPCPPYKGGQGGILLMIVFRNLVTAQAGSEMKGGK